MAVRTAKTNQVASAPGVPDPGVAVRAVEYFVEGEEDGGAEGIGGEAFLFVPGGIKNISKPIL